MMMVPERESFVLGSFSAIEIELIQTTFEFEVTIKQCIFFTFTALFLIY
jgi:hypothetical protein